MGVKVEGVRSDERVAVVDTTARNRKFLFGGAVLVVVAAVLIFVVVTALKPTPTYGPVGHQFQVNFGGATTQSSSSQVGGFAPTSGVTGVQSWRFGNSTTSETVIVENVPNYAFGQGAEATNLLLQEVPGSKAVTISGLPGVEATSSGSNSFSSAFPYNDIAVLLQGDTQFVISASGTTQAAVQSFVHSFKTTG